MTSGGSSADAAFAAAMAAFAPWEPAPLLGLAISGGADSMALARLAGAWLGARRGEGIALVVDHGLRPGSAGEAAVVAGRCHELGLRAEVLTVAERPPRTGIEAWARRRRYELLERACRRHGVLHLATAHHADDQAETIALRRDRGSGPGGLAGMAACVERPALRLLRPLLAWPKARLVAVCTAAGLTWVEDPMNADPRFARARLRSAGSDIPPPATTERPAFEAALARALPAVAEVDRFGVGRLQAAPWRRLDARLRQAVLARLALVVGGAEHAPPAAAVERLDAALAADGAAATLGRCRWRPRGGEILVEREGRGLPATLGLAAGDPVLWDGRFEVVADRGGVNLGPLGAKMPAPCRAARRRLGLSAAATAALPALFDLEGVLAVPHLGYARRAPETAVQARCRPRHSLAPVPFAGAPAV